MPSFKTAGKSKEDLSLVAQLAGLLNTDETSVMTRSQLIRFLEKENEKAELAEQHKLNTTQTAPGDKKEKSTGRRISKAVAGRKKAEPAIPAEARAEMSQAAEKPAEPTVLSVGEPAESYDITAVLSKSVVSPESVALPARKPGAGRPKTVRMALAPAAEAVLDVVVKERKKPGRKPGSGRKKLPAAPEMPIAGEAQPSAEPAQTPSAESVQAPSRQRRKPGRKAKAKPGQAVETTPAEEPITGETPSQPVPAGRRVPARHAVTYTGSRIDISRSIPPAEHWSSPVSAGTAAGLEAASRDDSAESSPEAAEAADEQSLTAADLMNMRNEQGSRRVGRPMAGSSRYAAPPPQNLRSKLGIHRTRPLTPATIQSDSGNEQDASRQSAQDEQNNESAENNRKSKETSHMEPARTGPVESGRPGTSDLIPLDEQGEPLASDSARTADASAGPEGDTSRERRSIVDAGEPQGGVLEIMPDGYGFLRKDNYLQGNKDIYVPPQYIRRFGLRPGDYITGPVRLQRETDRYQALLYIKDVNGQSPEKMLHRPHFDRLTPIYPDDRFILETVRNELSTRIIDLVAPIGKGQRGMIVSPPKAGKTILLQKIANAISVNNPDTKLIVLLIDERPEEVTDMQRSIKGEVVYSTFDKTPENHTKVVELVLERAMRLVELKQDVIILLDSMTRLARAYNLTINPTGRTLSGGLDPGALYGPKRFFGAARNIENGGSLTIIATSLIETGSRMDEVIFEEFKGTGNMEVYLDRKLSEKRIFPAIDINKSGTRREELLMNTKELDAVWTIRKAFSQLDTSAVTEAIINLLLKTKNNDHFISSVNVSFNDKNVFDAMRGVRPGTQGAQSGQSGSGNTVNPGSNPGGYGYGGSYNNTGYGSKYQRTGSGDDD